MIMILAMSKFFKDNGFFSDDGLKLSSGVESELLRLFSSGDVQNMSEAEIQTLAANLKKAIGDCAANVAVGRNVSKEKTKAANEAFRELADRWATDRRESLTRKE